MTHYVWEIERGEGGKGGCAGDTSGEQRESSASLSFKSRFSCGVNSPHSAACQWTAIIPVLLQFEFVGLKTISCVFITALEDALIKAAYIFLREMRFPPNRYDISFFVWTSRRW